MLVLPHTASLSLLRGGRSARMMVMQRLDLKSGLQIPRKLLRTKFDRVHRAAGEHLLSRAPLV
jgi:hypothetical protein